MCAFHTEWRSAREPTTQRTVQEEDYAGGIQEPAGRARAEDAEERLSRALIEMAKDTGEDVPAGDAAAERFPEGMTPVILPVTKP